MFEEGARCSMIALGAQQEVNSVAGLVNGPIKVPPLAGNLDTRFVHSPARADRALASAANSGESRQHLDSPPVDGRVIDRYASFGHYSSRCRKLSG